MVGLVCSSISSVVAFLLTKGKYDSEVDSQHIKNMGDAFKKYKEVMDEMYKSQDIKIKAVQKENDDLKQQVNHLQAQMLELLNTACFNITCKLRRAGFPTEGMDTSVNTMINH